MTQAGIKLEPVNSGLCGTNLPTEPLGRHHKFPTLMLFINVDCKHNPAGISPVSCLHILVHAGILPSNWSASL